MNNKPKFCLVEPANTRGRDLVIGDLHGSISQLHQCLDRARFDPSCDRVFSVGDLIDRGENSFACLSLIKEPWFYPVRGNHDDMLLSALDRYDSIYHSADDFIPNGGMWLFRLDPSQRRDLEQELAPILEGLPHVRMVQGGPGQHGFNVAHAELIAPHSGNDNFAVGDTLVTDDLLASLAGPNAQSVFDERAMARMQAVSTWSRKLVQEMKKSKDEETGSFLPDHVVSGQEMFCASTKPYEDDLSVTFVGHSIVPYIGLHRSHLYLDRGAFMAGQGDSYGLAMVDAQAALAWVDRHLPRERYKGPVSAPVSPRP